MVFPLSDKLPHHACRPLRPTHPPPKIFSTRDLEGSRRQEISLTEHRLHLRWLEGRRPVRSIRFAPEDLPVLELALERSKIVLQLENVGRIEMKIGGYIDVGAGPGLVAARMVFDDQPSRSSIRLRDYELVALAMAITELKSTAATPQAK